MKKLSLFTFVIAILFAACQNNNSGQTAGNSAEPDTNIVPANEQFCYRYIKNRDTATMTMMSSGTITTGELKYNLFEKDKNSGVFEGELRGDTLIAEYTFNSEGKESVRQVAFLKKGNQLVEGFGDVEEKNGKMMFKDISKLSFGDSMAFEKIDCH